MEILPLFDLSIVWDLSETTLLLLLPIMLPRPLLPLEGAAESYPPPLPPGIYPSLFMFWFLFSLLDAAWLFYLLLLSYSLYLYLDLYLLTTHTSHIVAAAEIIKVDPPSWSSLSSPIFLFISLLCCLLNTYYKLSFISCLYDFKKKSYNANPSYLLLIIYSFLPDILIWYFIRSSTLISARSSVLRVRSRLGNPLEEDLEPSFLKVFFFRPWKK